MRRLPARPELPPTTLLKIGKQTTAIEAIEDFAKQVDAANSLYKSARGSKWFLPAVEALSEMAGAGQRCMCCSGGEAAQVEHYRPKGTYPSRSFVWTNLLWICSVCNLYKGDQFDESCQPVNPIEEQVWEYFFIDEFGNLCPRWSHESGSLNSRAVETIRLYSLDRQALQETRLARLQELVRLLSDSTALKDQDQLSDGDLQLRLLEIHANPLQPDVADYFLNGPGSTDLLFEQFFEVAGL